MGAKAISQGGGTSAASKSRNSASGSVRRQTDPSGASAIQMAGHAEDLCFVGRWLVKRADKTEINQYRKKEIPGNAPNFDGPFYSAADVLTALTTSGENVAQEALAKINLMAETMEPDGKGFMLLENAKAGMTSPEMRDLKMGIHTASGTDQERHDVTGLAKVTKILRHDIMDYISDSSSRGYRDEDRWQLSKLGDNTDELKRMLDRASMPALSRIERDLARFRGWLENTSVVYVGMSLLVLAGGDQGKAVAIDFEHPIRRDDPSFIEHRDGIVLGVGHLHQMVAEFRRTFAERTRRKEIERDRRTEEFRKEQLRALAAPVGSINYSSQYGRKDIGNDDL